VQNFAGEFGRDPHQMSRKGQKTPVGAHTPQKMLLTPGVSFIKSVLRFFAGLYPREGSRERIMSPERRGEGQPENVLINLR
jgi:hypothetical protein